MVKIICFLLFAQFIHAEISWSPIEELAHPGVIYHDIATDSKGNSHAIWIRKDQNNLILETAVKYFQEDWGNPVFLSNLLKEEAALPAMIIDSLDNVHLIWVENDGSIYSLKTAVRSLYEKWSSAEIITSGQPVFSEVCLTKNSFGSVFAAWNKKFSEKLSIIQTSEKERDGHWSEPIDLTPQGYYGHIDIGADDLRNVYAIWTSIESGIAYVQTSQRLSGDHWSAPSDFDCPGRFWGYYRKHGIQTRIAVNALGDAFEVSKFTVDNILNSVRCSQKNAESDWSESKSISGSHSGAKLILYPQIVVDNLGNAFSTWYKYVPSFFSEGAKSIEVVSYSKMKGWSDPQSLIESSTPIGIPKIAVDHFSNAIVIWEAKKEPNCMIQASFFSNDQGWSPPLDVSLNNPVLKTSPKVIIDNMRRAHISWIEGTENQGIIKIIIAKID